MLARAFEHRFDEGELAGHALGNLVLAGLVEATGDLVAGVEAAARLLGAVGSVLPATTEPVVLKADAEHGEVAGQVACPGPAASAASRSSRATPTRPARWPRRCAGPTRS